MVFTAQDGDALNALLAETKRQTEAINAHTSQLQAVEDELIKLNADCPGNFYPPYTDITTTVDVTNKLQSCTKPRNHEGEHGSA